MGVACDALDQTQDEQVRLSGLKLLLGVAAAGASPSAATTPKTAPGPSAARNTDGSSGNRLRSDGTLLHGGGGDGGMMSPLVLSRAKRLLEGVSNIDESADARRLAAEALVALQY
ncbi:unnamed protein product [Laminaria digitata]